MGRSVAKGPDRQEGDSEHVEAGADHRLLEGGEHRLLHVAIVHVGERRSPLDHEGQARGYRRLGRGRGQRRCAGARGEGERRRERERAVDH